MLRYFFLSFTAIVLCVVALAGFRYDPKAWLFKGSTFSQPPLQIFPDMKHQPKLQPQHPSEFFADHRGARQLIPGTIPVGYNLPRGFYQTGANNVSDSSSFAVAPDYYNTGRMDDVYGDGLPVEVNASLMARGQERYNINCAICHGAGGKGDGIIKTYGLVTIASLQDERIRTMPDGQIYNTITSGKNTMGAYGPQIAVEDRWAIVAYLRALQKSQNVKLAELPEAKQQELNTIQ